MPSTNTVTTSTSSLPGISAAPERRAPTTFALGGLRGKLDILCTIFGLFSIALLDSLTGGYVDKAGVALTNGGGSLVLGSHDRVNFPLVLVKYAES